MFKSDSSSVEGKSAEVSSISNPESAPVWAKYVEFPIDSVFHVIVEWDSSGSVVTACNGRWSTAAKSETNAAPPHRDRCDACERYRIERAQIEIGLRELCDAPKIVLQRHWLAEYEAAPIGGCSCRAGLVTCALHEGPNET